MLNLGDGLRLPVDAVTQTFGLLAKRGAGKTHTALVLVEELLKAQAQVVIADPVGVTWGLRAAANGKDAGLPIIVMGGDHGDVPLEAAAGNVIAEFVVETQSSVVLDLSLLRKGDQVRFMTDFAETLYHRNRAPLHLVLDEADFFSPQRPMHGQERMLGAIQDLVRRGRARGIGVTLVTQRAAVLSKDVLTQCEVLIALRTIAPQDREAIDAWILAHDAHGQRAEFMASLASLPVGTAWFWSPGWLDVFKRVRIRTRETFDSSATPKVGAPLRAPKKLAPVDLEILKQQITATIEKAKADNPKLLRIALQETKAELAAAQAKLMATERALVLKAARDTPPSPSEVRTLGPESRTDAVPWPDRGTWNRATGTSRKGPMARGTYRIMAALADRGALTPRQILVRAGLRASGTSSGYLAYLQRADLVSRGQDGAYSLSERALRTYGPFPTLPKGPDLLAHWLTTLSAGAGRILSILADHYPAWMERQTVLEKAGLRESGTSLGYLGLLANLDLVERHEARIRMSAELSDSPPP